ncbi:protein-disulfide reductase DsbD domain-containing protein [Frigidibacter sp. MR17.14]|uniref:protein-disulfide reductase DsbD domain-containing protein n=1 Tax=Frigidibacter sp. MR17.14 TaxID=3126509 RepID=UPI0030131574
MIAWPPISRPLPALRRLVSAVMLSAGAVLSGATAMPALAGPQVSDMVQASLLPGWQTASGTRMTALKLELADGWKTYWRSPGDAGIPPEFNWSGSQNLGSVSIRWPVPEVFELNGMRSIGYKHALVLPIEITPKDPSQPVHLNAGIDIGVCRDICVPVSLRTALDLTGEGAPDPAIRAALSHQPLRGADAGVSRVSCTVAPTADGLRVTATLTLPAPRGTAQLAGPGGAGAAEIAVFEPSDPTLWVSDSETERQGDRLVASSDLVPSTPGPVMLDRSRLRITVLSPGRAVEIAGCDG